MISKTIQRPPAEIQAIDPSQPGLALAKAWNPRDADEIAWRCVGAVVLGMPRWRFRDGDGQDVLLPTEFNHYEGAFARPAPRCRPTSAATFTPR